MVPVAALAVTETISWGVLYYAFAVLLVPMEADLGWGPATISVAFSIALVVSGLAAPFVGRWVDQFGPRRVMTGGSAIASAAVLAWSQVESVAAMYVVWAVIGLGMAGTLYEPAVATVGRFAPRQRNLALLVITIVAGFATTIFSPLTAMLAASHGWRTALVVLAAVLAVTILVHHLALPGPLTPAAGRCAAEGVGDPGPNRNVIGFARVAAVFAVTHGVSVGVTTHLIAFFVSMGHDPVDAASFAAAVGGAKAAGRVVVTWLLRRCSAARVTAAVVALQAAGVVIPLALRSGFGAGLLVILFGSSSGALTILRPALVAEQFGDRDFGLLNGRVGRVSTLLGAAAPAVVGFAVAGTGTYVAPWLLLGVVSVAAVVALLGVRSQPPVRSMTRRDPSA